MAIALGVSVANAATTISSSGYQGIIANGNVDYTNSETSVNFGNVINQDGASNTSSNSYAIVAKTGVANVTFTANDANISIGKIYVRSSSTNAKAVINVTGSNSTINSIGGIISAGNNQGTEINFTGANATLAGITILDASSILGSIVVPSALVNINFSGQGNNQITNGFSVNNTGGHVRGVTSNINFKATTGSDNISKVSGGIRATNATNNFIFNSVSSSNIIEGNIQGIGGTNNIVVKQGTTTISGDIIGSVLDGTSGKNTIALGGKTATIGSPTSKVALKLDQAGVANGTSVNLVLLNATTSNSIYLSEMSSRADYHFPSKNLNILSLNQGNNNTFVVDSISAVNGSNVIGKGFLQANSSTGFAELVSIANQKDALTSAYAANVGDTLVISGGITVGANANNVINITGTLDTSSSEIKVLSYDSGSAGTNYIHASGLRANKISASVNSLSLSSTAPGGANYILIDNDADITSLEAKGNGYKAGGTNTIIVKGTLTLRGVTALAGGTNIVSAKALNDSFPSTLTTTGATNKFFIGGTGVDTVSFTKSLATRGTGGYSSHSSISLQATNTFLGSESDKVNITIDRADGTTRYSSYVLLNGSNNSAYIDNMTVRGYYNNTGSLNILSLNDGSSTVNISSLTATSGNNIIGKAYLTQDTNNGNVAILNNQAADDVTTDKLFDQNGAIILSNFMTDANKATANITIGTVQANSRGSNFINASSLNVDKIFLTSIETANNNAGVNYIVVDNLTASTIINGDKAATIGGTMGSNYIQVGTRGNITKLWTKNGPSKGAGNNYITMKQDANLTIGQIVTENGANVVASKNLFLQNGATFNSSVNNVMSDANAINGQLAITQGIVNSGGKTVVSFKANSSTTSTIIGADATTGKAISGSADVYINASGSGIASGIDAIETYATSVASGSDTAYTTLANSSIIAGDIQGAVNLKIVGSANTAPVGGSFYVVNGNTNKSQVGILGNITASSGTTNIVLENSFFASSAVIASNQTTQSTLGGEKFGNITNNGGTINMITRFSADPNFGDTAIYNVTNNAGTTNIVLQGNLDIGANVSYTSEGAINFIFANGNSGADDFGANSTDVTTNKIVGQTYNNGLKLTLQDKTISVGDTPNASFINTYGHYFTAINEGKTSTFTTNRTANQDTITIKGLVLGTISTLETTNSKTYDVSIAKDSAFVGNVSLAQGSKVSLTMDQGSKLLTDSDVFFVEKLTLKSDIQFNLDQLTRNTFAQTNTIIDLATMGSDLGNVDPNRKEFRVFAVGGATSSADTGLRGNNALFRVYVNDKADQSVAKIGGVSVNNGSGQYGYAYSGRIIIADTGVLSTPQNASTHYLQVIAGSNTDLGSIHYNGSLNESNKGGTAIAGNIAVATVKNDTTNITKTTDNQTQAVVVFKAQNVIQGFDQVSTTLTAQTTDQYGMTDKTNSGGWTTYFVNSMSTTGATSERGEVSAATLATNYDLYMANFNSLNKRMGELRDNDNSQGAWARIFNGSQSNDFGLGTKTNYTTFQGGYDYAFGFEGANNYLGVALSYSMSTSEVQNSLTQALDNNIVGFDNVKSSAVEVALYNSYVQDEGWYNDSIFKFSYIMSDFNIFGQSTTYNTSNMAFTLSDEFGYRFKLGNDKEWYIDPQAEFSFGYFDQTELKQTLGEAWLNTLADSVITMRSRFGSSFGYDFKKFTANKPIKASVYVGAFYEYDYVGGGDVSLTTNLGGETTNSSAISSDGRVVMNVGTNMTIKDNTRIYFDFESSFAGKINTDYQVNVGVRYSFGENTGYTPMTAKREVVPLKISEEKTEENKEKENSTDNTSMNNIQQ